MYSCFVLAAAIADRASDRAYELWEWSQGIDAALHREGGVDALYHVGQVVSYRRAAGNPIDPQVNVFLGKKMDS